MNLENEVTDPLAVANQIVPPDPPPEVGPGFEIPRPAAPQQQVVFPKKGKGIPREAAGPLKQALPNPERIKIGRRRSDGHVAHVGYYSWADVARYKSVEAFLQAHIVPTYGGGEYELHYVKPDGSEEPRGVLFMETPPKEAQVQAAQTAPFDQAVRLVKQLTEDAERRVPQVDPIVQMRQLYDMQKQFQRESDSNSMGPMLFMMMQQMNQRPQGDSTESAMRLLELAKSMAPPPPPPPLPPPPLPSGPDPTVMMLMEMQKNQTQLMVESMKAQAENQRAMFEMLRHSEPKGTTPAELLQFAQAVNPKDNLGARDILPMISTIKDIVKQPERDMIRDAVEGFRMLKMAASEFDSGKGGGFREFAEGLLPRGIDSITELVQTIRAKEAEQAAAMQQPLQGTQPGQSGVIHNPGVVPGQPAMAAPQPQMPKFPPGFEADAKAINRAKDAAEAVGLTVTALLRLGQSKDFRTALETLIRHVRGGDRERALDMIKEFLMTIGQMGFIDEDAANLAMGGFEDNWEDVSKMILGMGNGKSTSTVQ